MSAGKESYFDLVGSTAELIFNMCIYHKIENGSPMYGADTEKQKQYMEMAEQLILALSPQSVPEDIAETLRARISNDVSTDNKE